MSLAGMKNDLIRRILDEDNASVLKEVKEILEPTPRTKEELLADFDEACKEVRMSIEGKIKLKTLEEALNEL
jgi:hypothetical protein